MMLLKRLIKINRTYLSCIQQGSFRYRFLVAIILTASAAFYSKSHHSYLVRVEENISANSAAQKSRPKPPVEEYQQDILFRSEALKPGHYKPETASSLMEGTNITQDAIKNYSKNVLRSDESTAFWNVVGETHLSMPPARKDVKLSGVQKTDVERKYKASLMANVTSLEGVNFDILTDHELIELIFAFLLKVEVRCFRPKRFGRIADGGQVLCDEVGVQVQEPCVVYSFEIRLNLTFEDAIATKRECTVTVWTTDDTGEMSVNRSEKITVYKGRLSTRTDENATATSFLEFDHLPGHQQTTIDVIKMDMDGAEWDLLPQMLNSDHLNKAKYLLVEFHLLAITRRYILPKLELLQALEAAGFKKYYTKRARGCELVAGGSRHISLCYKVGYMSV